MMKSKIYWSNSLWVFVDVHFWNNFSEVKFTYNKMLAFKVYSLMGFNNLITFFDEENVQGSRSVLPL